MIVGQEALQVTFTMSQGKLISQVTQSTYTSSVPPIQDIMILGEFTQVTSVQVSVNGSPFNNAQFSYNTTSGELDVVDLSLDLTQPFVLLYS